MTDRQPELELVWQAYDALLRRCLALEEIADRLAVTCVDPIATDDYHLWKVGGTGSVRG